MSPACLILGTGYLGQALARRLAVRGERLVLTTRSPASLAPLAAMIGAEVHPLHLDAFDPRAFAAALGPAHWSVYCLLTPSALETVSARECLRSLLVQLAPWRAILSSSTGIYGTGEGATVNADTPIHPGSAREQRLLDIERAWLASPGASVVRLAGLYGPGRIIGQRAVMEAEVLPGTGSAWLNLIHRDDAADLLLTGLRPALHPQPVELGADGSPVRRAQYYADLAQRLGAPAPRFALAAGGDQGKRVDPTATWQRFDWRPRYPTHAEGLEAALRAG